MNIASPHTIVVVDDDLNLHELIKNYFEQKNFKVQCYATAAAAVAESLASGSKWDILLTDYHFSKMLASDFTKEINKNLPSLPIILITPLEHLDSVMTVNENDSYDFIGRPIHLGLLKAAVDRALKIKSLRIDNSALRDVVKLMPPINSPLVGQSPIFLAAVDIAKRVSESAASILLFGESGCGKEVFANFIHSNSTCNKGPFVAINCSSIPDNLLESELFGHAKGSFTGAVEKRIGLFEAAENGTLFLDEIGDLSLHLQAKLLRVLQEKKIKRIGENKDIPLNCRIVSATHKDLSTEIKEGRFREDLFFRLNVIQITIPPLRDRPEDIPLLAEIFLKKYLIANQSVAKKFSKEALKFIMQNQWRGNVRELKNTVERSVILSSGDEIQLEDCIQNCLADSVSSSSFPVQGNIENTFSIQYCGHLPRLEDVINKYIEYAVEANSGAKDKTAKEIGIDRKTLYRHIRENNDNHVP